MLGIVAVILLVGVENLIAQEEKGCPIAEQKQKGQVEQLRRQRALEKPGRGRVEGMQQRRWPRAVREVEPERVRALQQKAQRPRQDRLIQDGAGRLLDELTKAYRENDREKMGQLIRKMNQLRQKMQKARVALGERMRDFRGRPEAARPSAKKERPERRKAAPKDTDRPGPPMLRRGMGRRGQGMQGKGMSRWGRGYQRGGIGGWGQGFQGRGMRGLGRGLQGRGRGMGGWGRGYQRGGIGGWGQGFQGRGMRGLGRGLQGRGRGMGGWGRGVPGPWCPWWSAPGPERD